MRIYIIGFMGSGKTFFGKKLADCLGFDFIDLDELFEERYKISVDDFFNKYGEAEFRLIEHKLLVSTFNEHNTVISTGGGTPCFYQNIELINEHGYSLYIKVSPEVLYYRLKRTRRPRPLLKQTSGHTLWEEINRLMNEREKYYSQAKMTITEDHASAEDIATLLLANLKGGGE
jgi:shikimate kinase